MKLISTRTHGVMDYTTVALLFMLPRALRWGNPVKGFLTFMSLFLLGYSAITRYELGMARRLPMRGHLTLDALSGSLMTISPMLLRTRSPFVNAILIGLGLCEIGASLTTDPNDSPMLREQSTTEFAVPLDVREYLNQ